MKITSQYILLGLLIVTLSGCATIMRGNSQDFTVNSNPAGARILVDGEDRGTTPTTLTLKRNKTYQIVFRLYGYEDVTMNLNREFKAGAAIVGNIFSWGIIGIVVDVANGSAYQLTPEELNATLRQVAGASHLDVDEEHIQVFFFTPDQVDTQSE